jgi:hypothetical protein
MHFVHILHVSICLWANYDNIVTGIIFDGNIHRRRCVQDTQVCEGMRYHTQMRPFIVTGQHAKIAWTGLLGVYNMKVTKHLKKSNNGKYIIREEST